MSRSGSQVVDLINEKGLPISAQAERDRVDKDHINVMQKQSEPNRVLLEFEHSQKRTKPIKSCAIESMRRMKISSLKCL